MKKILSLLPLILSFGAIPNFAQTESQDICAQHKLKMDSVFQFIDRKQIETGILLDYGFNLLNPAIYNGIPSDSNFVDQSTFEILYAGLYDSQINDGCNLIHPDFFRQNDESIVHIMYMDYNIISPNALEKELIRLENEQIHLNYAKTLPCDKKFCFAVSPHKTKYKSQTIELKFQESHFFTNSNLSISKIEIRSDEHTDFETINFGNKWIYEFHTTGSHTLIFRITMSNGNVLQSHSNISIETITNNAIDTKKYLSKPIETFATIPADASQYGGVIQTIYLNKSQTGGKFIRPLVIVGDIDLSNLFGGEPMDLYSLCKSEKIGTYLNQLSKIFDIIYIKYNESTDNLMNNGEFFRRAMLKINENRFSISEESYVVGLGVGGIISRIGLNSMEAKGENHKVKKSISVNSPFRGLNIPPSIQVLIKDVYDLGSGIEILYPQIKNAVNKYYTFLESKAVRQLLFYNFNLSLEQDNTEHTLYLNTDWIKNIPKNCENIAIANGNSAVQKTKALLYQFRLKDTEDFAWIFGRIKYDIRIDGFTLPSYSEEMIYDSLMKLYVKICGITAKTFKNDIHHIYSTKDMLPTDGMFGVMIPKFSIPITFMNNSGISMRSAFCLIPLASSLDVDLKTFYSSNFEDVKRHIPFDRYYIHSHTNYGKLSDILPSLISELTPKITGKTYNILGTTELEVENVPDIALLKYTWNFKNNRFKVVSQSGTKATITPLKYSENNYSETEDFVSVSVSTSIPIEGLDLSGLKTPDAKIYADCISIDGGDNISSDFKPYGLNKVPDDVAQISWTASDGVIVSRVDDFSVKAKVNDIVDNAWIEASFNSYGVDHRFRKNLNSAALEKIEIVSADKWWNKHELVDKYFIRIKVHPTYLSADDLDFCWQNDVYVYDRDGKIVHRKNEDSDDKWPRADIDLPTISPDNPLGIRSGIAKIETAGTGSVGICLETKGPIMCDSTKIDIGNIGNLGGGLIRPSGMDFERVEPTPMDGSDALVTMPAVELDQTAKGNIYCKVSDTFGNSYEVSIPVESKWHAVYHAAPNPANSFLNISRQGNDAVAPMRAPATNRGLPVARALLYNDSMLVREAAIRADGTCRMNVGDLAEGTYYLNIVENDRIVMKQIVVIQH